MDNITHSLVGVLLARTGLHRAAPRATLTLVLAANGPDIDVVTWAGGSLTYLHYHRGLTHALIGVPGIAGLVVFVSWLLRKRSAPFSWARSYGLALLGVGTHPLLDYSNTYGIRPWLPFSGTWHSADVFFIVDIWIWIVLGLSLAAPAFGRLINREIGAPSGAGGRAAVAGLLFLVVWWGARSVLHRRAVAMLQAHSYGPAGGERNLPQRLAAFPTPTNPFAWHGYVETRTFHLLTPVRVLAPYDPSRGRFFYKPEPSPALEAAWRTDTARRFAGFARYLAVRVDAGENGYRVLLTDLRFAGERPNAFVCTIRLDESLRVLEEDFSF